MGNPGAPMGCSLLTKYEPKAEIETLKCVRMAKNLQLTHQLVACGQFAHLTDELSRPRLSYV
jgi:hypothetical protein